MTLKCKSCKLFIDIREQEFVTVDHYLILGLETDEPKMEIRSVFHRNCVQIIHRS